MITVKQKSSEIFRKIHGLIIFKRSKRVMNLCAVNNCFVDRRLNFVTKNGFG